MGWALLLQVLPLALGAAMSPTVLTVEMLVLSGGSGSLRRGWGLALGRMTGLLAISVVGVSISVQLPALPHANSLWEAVIAAAGGVVLLLLGVREWRAPRPPEHRTRLAGRLERLGPVSLFGFGIGWQLVNVSTLALYLPALHLIASSSADLFVQVVAFVILFAFTEAVVLVPVLALSLAGERARPPLERLHAWVSGHAHQITLVVLLGFGAGLLLWAALLAARLLAQG